MKNEFKMWHFFFPTKDDNELIAVLKGLLVGTILIGLFLLFVS